MDKQRAERVLVIDDDPATRQVLEKGLRRLGYEVESASDGEEGLAKAIANPHDVILTDIQMPKMDGHTLLRRLEAQGVDCAVVMMSGHGGMEDVIDALRHGAVDYLKKPWVTGDLVAAVSRAVEISDTRRTIRTTQFAAREIPADIRVPATSPPGVSPFESASATPQTAKESQAAIFADILSELRSGALTLSPIPTILNELRALLSKPQTSIEQVVAVIERDPSATAQMIRLANSVLHSGLTRVSDVQTAIGRIGFRQVENMAETAFAKSCYRETDARFRPLQSKIWRYSVARAIAMRALAELAGPASLLNPGRAYLVGLMSDVGAAFLIWVVSERDRAMPRSRDSDALVDCAAMIRTHHQEVGSMLIRSWNLDPNIAMIAGSHHEEAAPAASDPYWSLTVLAANLADELAGHQDVTRSHAPSAALIERCAHTVRIGHGALKRVEARLHREAEAIWEIMT